jgi:hypothetical protein
MSVMDEVLEANEISARTHELRRLTPHPARELATLTCMDTRLSFRTLGLMTGDAHHPQRGRHCDGFSDPRRLCCSWRRGSRLQAKKRLGPPLKNQHDNAFKV